MRHRSGITGRGKLRVERAAQLGDAGRRGLGIDDERVHRRGRQLDPSRSGADIPARGCAITLGIRERGSGCGDALVLDRRLGRRLGAASRAAAPASRSSTSQLRCSSPASTSASAAVAALDLGDDRLEVGNGDAALRHRGAQAVGEPALEPLPSLDLNPGGLEAACRRVASGAGCVEALAGRVRPVANAASASAAASQRPSACSSRRRASFRLALAARHSSCARLPRNSVSRTLMVRNSIAATDCSLSSVEPRRRILEEIGQAPNDHVGAVEAVRCLLASGAQRAHAGRLLHEGSTLSRSCLDDAVDIVLHHDGVAVLGEPGPAEQSLEVAQPGAVAVDAELGVTLAARDAPAHRHLGILGWQAAILVVHHELHLGESHALTATAARVDDLVHALAAELAGVRLTERPAHGVDQVALAAAVRPDDRGDPRVEEHLATSGERLEPGQGDPPEPHPRDCPRAELGASTSWAGAISQPQDLVLTP